MDYSIGTMVAGGSGGVDFIGVIKRELPNGMYEISPAIVSIGGEWINLSTPLKEKTSIDREVTPEDFDIFHDVSKTKALSFDQVIRMVITPIPAGRTSRKKSRDEDNII